MIMMSLLMVWMVCTCPEGAVLKIWLKSDEFKGIKNPSKIGDICRFLAGVHDDFDVPDWGWCP